MAEAVITRGRGKVAAGHMTDAEVAMLFYVVVLLFSLFACAPASQAEDKVVIGFYSESLCPDCIAFTNRELSKAFQEIPSIFELHYVPWGNAKLLSSGKFECQHGPMECVINTVEACVLHWYNSTAVFLPFLMCMDSHKENQDMEVAEKCAMASSMNWTAINTCSQGDMGHKLELLYAQETGRLEPPHKYTPWITINNEHSSLAENGKLIRAVCEAYTGTNKPQACSTITL